VLAGAVLLFDFGAQVAGYRSDMTRTLFVGEPTARDLDVYHLVAGAQAASLELVAAHAREGTAPSGKAADAAARQRIDAAGHGDHFGHGTGHGIGLATHEQPRLARTAPETPLPSPTVFSVEPGVYLEGQTGVRIEDLVHFDPGSRRMDRLTRFPSEVVVVGG
jgi:Xaa-Pro aminopeptidase